MDATEKKKMSKQEKKKVVTIATIVIASVCVLAIVLGLLFGLQPWKKTPQEIENIPENCLTWQVKSENGTDYAVVTGLTEFGRTVDRIIIPHTLKGVAVCEVARDWIDSPLNIAATKVFWQGVSPQYKDSVLGLALKQHFIFDDQFFNNLPAEFLDIKDSFRNMSTDFNSGDVFFFEQSVIENIYFFDTVIGGEKISAPPKGLTKDGYRLLGWRLGNEDVLYDFDTRLSLVFDPETGKNNLKPYYFYPVWQKN